MSVGASKEHLVAFAPFYEEFCSTHQVRIVGEATMAKTYERHSDAFTKASILIILTSNDKIPRLEGVVWIIKQAFRADLK